MVISLVLVLILIESVILPSQTVRHRLFKSSTFVFSVHREENNTQKVLGINKIFFLWQNQNTSCPLDHFFSVFLIRKSWILTSTQTLILVSGCLYVLWRQANYRKWVIWNAKFHTYHICCVTKAYKVICKTVAIAS